MPEPLKEKILIVEDEPALRLTLGRELRAQHFQVIEAGDGEAGLAAAKAERPDLILLDIVLPKMDGLEMLRNLRDDAWGKTAPVMLLTNLDDPNRVAEAAEYGVTDYIVKADWDIGDIVRKIQSKLDS